MNVGELCRNSGECPGGSGVCAVVGSPNFARLRRSSHEGARMLLVYPGTCMTKGKPRGISCEKFGPLGCARTEVKSPRILVQANRDQEDKRATTNVQDGLVFFFLFSFGIFLSL